MNARDYMASALIGAVAGARSMTPIASIVAARLTGRRTPGQLSLLDRPLFKVGALVMGIGELFVDKMKAAPPRTILLGQVTRVVSAGISGAALAPKGHERAGAAVAVTVAVPMAYAALGARRRASAQIGQTRSGLVEDAVVVMAGVLVVLLATKAGRDR